jgi:hypothetical protein
MLASDPAAAAAAMCGCAVVQVTEGPDAGKLALLDFGLVAEIPAQDRAAMVRGLQQQQRQRCGSCFCVDSKESQQQGWCAPLPIILATCPLPAALEPE